MLSILRQRTYRRLFLAHVVSLVGTGLATVALGLLAYGLAGARAGGVLGTALAIKMVAYVGVAPVAATLLEGRPRRTVLAVAQGVRLASALALPLVDQVWQVYLLIAVLQCASAVFTPTLSSVVPDVLPREEDYTSALSLTRVAADLESVLSPGLAAGLLLVLPAGRLFDITALGFAASALLIAGAGVPARAPGSREAPFWERVRRGTALFVRLRALRPVVALDVVVAAPCAFVLVHSVVLVRERLGLGEAALGVVLAVNGAGSMLPAPSSWCSAGSGRPVSPSCPTPPWPRRSWRPGWWSGRGGRPWRSRWAALSAARSPTSTCRPPSPRTSPSPTPAGS